MSDERKLHCAHCGDVIGAYEPVIALIDGEARETTKSAVLAREDPPVAGACYHSGCYARRRDATV